MMSLREKWHSLRMGEAARNIWWGICAVWSTSPGLAAFFLCMKVIEGLSPAITVYATQRLIDETIRSAGQGPSAFWAILPWIVLFFVSSLLMSDLLWRIEDPPSKRLVHHLDALLEDRRLDVASRLPLIAFESGDTYDKLSRAERPGRKVYRVFLSSLYVMRSTISVVSIAALFAAVSPWISAAMLLLLAPYGVQSIRSNRIWLQLTYEQTEAQRKIAYHDDLMNGRNEQKELRIFGIKPLLAQRWGELRRIAREESIRQQRRIHRLQLPAAYGYLAMQLAVIVVMVFALADKRMTAGLFVALFTAVGRLGVAAQTFASEVRDSLNSAGEVGFVRECLAMAGDAAKSDESNAERPAFPLTLSEGITFDRVSFGYPGRSPVLDELSLTIRPGEHVALVGDNGAGKSTIAKLLLGLYRPTSGAVRADGVDYADMDERSLPARMSAAFQDYFNFEFTLGQSIAAGDPALLAISAGLVPAGGPKSPAAAADTMRHATHGAPHGGIGPIRRAAELGGANEVAAALPNGYDSPVGYKLEGGTGLSGGQWQRIALSRALAREVPLLVLDEPTAALDPRAEAELYDRFHSIMHGKTVVLITHRLGAARMADRIIVLRRGRIIEEGRHEQLLQSGGVYAAMWGEQSQWYR